MVDKRNTVSTSNARTFKTTSGSNVSLTDMGHLTQNVDLCCFVLYLIRASWIP